MCGNVEITNICSVFNCFSSVFRFLVDRMHYRGHVACSRGYCMDTYKEDIDIASTNSQVNEQANAALRNLATQISYMHVENVLMHTGVFLAIRNQDKQLAMV